MSRRSNKKKAPSTSRARRRTRPRVSLSLADVVPREVLLYLERFASEAPPARYRARIRENEIS